MGFSHRPLALRRRLLAVLDRIDSASLIELASHAYAGRINRLRPPSCSAAQLSATRKAICRLIDRGHVVAVGFHRRRRLYALADRPAFPPLELGSFDG
ncbi:hypothetical protein ACVMAJ_000249 [Bradyrhizobium sp. USDA 4448]